MKRNRKGSNQFKRKPRYHFWSSVWFIAFLVAVGLNFTKDHIVSPCPAGGCHVETVIAYEAPPIQTVRERVLLAGMREFGAGNVESLEKLVMKESHFNYMAINPTSGACGLFQFYPCRKMKCDLSDVSCQISAGMNYIKSRYGNPNKAWNFHLKHGYY